MLGTFFILLVYFVPGGIAGLLTRRPRRGLRLLEQSVLTEPAPAGTIDKAEAGA